MANLGVYYDIFLRIRSPAIRAGAPVDHFGLVDAEAVIVGRMQARGAADSAVDVRQLAALAAHHMVVIVANAGFVAGDMALRLYLPDDSQLREKLQRIVDSLVRHIGVPFANGRNDGFGIRVRVRSDSGQYRNAGLRNPHRCRLQHLLDPCL